MVKIIGELNVDENLYTAMWNEMVDSNTTDLRVPTPSQVFNLGRVSPDTSGED
jgi:hypothetical protein